MKTVKQMKKLSIVQFVLVASLLFGLSVSAAQEEQLSGMSKEQTPVLTRSSDSGSREDSNIAAGGTFTKGVKEQHRRPAGALGPQQILTASNGIYDLIISDDSSGNFGTYTLRTGQAYPYPDTGKNVFFGGAAGNPWSTYLTVRSYSTMTDYVNVGGEGMVTTQGYTIQFLNPYGSISPIGFAAVTGYSTVWNVPSTLAGDSLTITQVTNLEGSNLDDARLRVTTTVLNNGPDSVGIGIRYEWDLMVADNDSAWFAPRLPDQQFTDIFAGWTPPGFLSFEFTDNPSFPTFRIFGSVTGPLFVIPVNPPDKLLYAGWGDLYYNAFDVTPSGSGYDSGVGFYWGDRLGTAKTLNPGQSYTVTEYVYTREPFFIDLTAGVLSPDTVFVGNYASFDMTATSSYDCNICIGGPNLPGFVSLQPACGTSPVVGTVSLNPTLSDTGTYDLTFIADCWEGEVADTEYVRIVVVGTSTNQPPEFVNTCGDTIQVTEGDLFVCQISATDPDNDPISLTCPRKPSSAIFTDHGNGTASFSFTPDYRHVDRQIPVDFKASDGYTSVYHTLIIQVSNRQLNARVPPPNREILVSDSIVINFNEAVRESSLSGNVLITSRKASPITHRYGNSPAYSLIISSSQEFLKELDTIDINLDTGILDSANKPIDKAYSLTVYTGVLVFPGDANNDGIVDERDVLPMGLYWGNVGPARVTSPDLSPREIPAHTFVPQLMWTPLASVFADADGSGTIDPNDICGVTNNWVQTHPAEGGAQSGRIDELTAALKKFDGGVLRQLYAAAIDCPQGEGKAAVMQAFESLLGEPGENLPTTYELAQNYPNPFNPYTSIQFYLPQSGHVTLSIYNIIGQRVMVLFDGYRDEGYGEIIWDGTGQTGRPVASGIYFYRLESDDVSITKRMMLLK